MEKHRQDMICDETEGNRAGTNGNDNKNKRKELYKCKNYIIINERQLIK